MLHHYRTRCGKDSYLLPHALPYRNPTIAGSSYVARLNIAAAWLIILAAFGWPVVAHQDSESLE